MLTVGTSSHALVTITPTGQSTIVPSIYEVLVVGGGGGSGYAGGGAGGYVKKGSYMLDNATSLSLSLSVGSAGTSGVGSSTNGESSSLTGSSLTTLTAGGGTAGGSGTGASAGSGGNTGSGDVSYTGASGGCSNNYDAKNGNYVDCSRWGAGGGAAWTGNGNTPTVDPDNPLYGNVIGGAGKNGETHYEYTGGAGGRAYGTMSNGAAASTRGSYGSGGDYGSNNSQAGMISFKYWAPV